MHVLKLDSVGSEVKKLQQMLNLQFSKAPALVVDGIFGRKTHFRVIEFQKSCNLVMDGIVGIQTLKVLVPAVIQGVCMSVVKQQLSRCQSEAA